MYSYFLACLHGENKLNVLLCGNVPFSYFAKRSTRKAGSSSSVQIYIIELFALVYGSKSLPNKRSVSTQ